MFTMHLISAMWLIYEENMTFNEKTVEREVQQAQINSAQ